MNDDNVLGYVIAEHVKRNRVVSTGEQIIAPSRNIRGSVEVWILLVGRHIEVQDAFVVT